MLLANHKGLYAVCLCGHRQSVDEDSKTKQGMSLEAWIEAVT